MSRPVNTADMQSFHETRLFTPATRFPIHDWVCVCVTVGVGRVCLQMCSRAYCSASRDLSFFSFFFLEVLPSETRDVADVYLSLRRGASGWIVEPAVFLFRKFHFHPISIFQRVNHDSMGRQGRLDLPEVGFRLRSVVFSAASPLL